MRFVSMVRHRTNAGNGVTVGGCANRCLPWAALWLLSACSVTGLDSASTRFNCNAPRGIPCSSTSGVYANSIAGTLPPTSTAPTPAADAATSAPPPASASLPTRDALELPRRVVPGAGQAIRSLPKQLRVLVFPWVDADNDLHDQAYMYMAVDPGRWLIEHARAAIRNDAPTPRLAGADAAAEPAAPGAPEGRTDADADADADARRTPAPVVIPHAGPLGTPRANPPLGIVEQRGQ